MENKQERKQKNHVIIITSDVADANVKQFRIKQGVLQGIVIAVCVIIGALLGYCIYEDRIWEVATHKAEAQQEVITQLEQSLKEQKTEYDSRIEEYEQEIESLTGKISILSDTVNLKTESENQLIAQLEQRYIPSEYPLTGSAVMEEQKEDRNICVFNASVGCTVAATGAGTVQAINDDGEYGHNVWIDHGNGYITIYRNQGNVIVKLGDTVAPGTTLFLIDKENARFGYQIMKEDAYIDPMEMLSING